MMNKITRTVLGIAIAETGYIIGCRASYEMGKNVGKAGYDNMPFHKALIEALKSII